jgi:hypothetical protein
MDMNNAIQGRHAPINGDLRQERPKIVGTQIKDADIKHGGDLE